MKKFSITLILLLSFFQWNCFGRFAIVRALYGFIDGINFEGSSQILTKFVKTILMWVIFVFPVIGGLAFAADLIVVNLIEFWTGKNVVDGHNDGTPIISKNNKEDSDSIGSGLIQPGKEIRFQSAKSSNQITLKRSTDGNTMTIRSFDGEKHRELIAKRDEPGVFYQNVDGKLIRITGLSDEDGNLDGILMGDRVLPVH